MKYRCVNFYSAEWGDSYPLPGYQVDEINGDSDKDSKDGDIVIFRMREAKLNNSY